MSVAVAVAALLVSVPAAAQDDQRARLHFESGASYYEAGEYEDALREFQRAYDLSQRPQLFYNLSLCYQNLGDLEQAASYLERFLREVPEIPNRANLELRLGNLRERIARESASTAAEPAIAPPPPAAPDPTEPPAATVTGTTATVTAAGSDAPPSGGPSGGDSLNVGAIVGFSIAAVGLVTGAIFGGLTVAEDSRLAGTACGMNATCAAGDLGTLRAYAAVTDVGLAVALAGATTGLVFLILGTGDAGDERAAIDVLPLAGRDGAGLSVGGSF